MRLRFIAIIAAFVFFTVGTFITYNFYQSKTVLLDRDPVLAAQSYQDLLTILLVLAALLVLAVVALTYLGLTVRTTARSIAYSFTKDIAFSRDRLRRFYELSPVPYLLVDTHARIKRPNKAALRLLSVSEEQIVNKELFELCTHPEHPEKLPRYKEEMKRCIPIEQKELQVRSSSGELRWVLFSAENLDEPSAKDPQLLVTLVDIHEQKELERIKTEFLSLASHQLRAPLANLKWYIDFLLKRRVDSLNPEVIEYLQKMYRRNEEMIDLVNTLLNLSRIEMGRVQVQKEETDLSELARSVVEELETAAQDKKITITAEVPDTLRLVTDGRLMRVVLQNLLTNAIRYTNADGSVTLTLAEDGTMVRFSVRDTGVGIPPEEQGRIFSKMYRATNAQSMEVNGNGIGLYMCKALSEALGGTIGFESVLGKGTVFTVQLPLH